MMTNKEIAKILYEISEYLAMQDIPFKPRAYEKAAHSIEEFEEDISDIYKKGGIKALEEIPGVGAGIAERIEELIKTGKSKYYEQLKKKMPVELSELTAIEGVGPKMIMKLYKNLGIRNLKDLERAARAGKIRHLEDFGEKTEENILKGINFLKKSGGRFVLGFVIPQIREIEKRIKSLKEVKQAVIGGSIRRMKETIGDGDLLVVVRGNKKPAFAKATAGKIMDFFVNMPEVMHVYSHGETKSSVKLKNGMDFDLRIVPEESFGAALQYFTGNKDHNIILRKIAIEKGLKLNEYGVFKGKKQIAGKTEEEVYKVLGLKWMEPELRTNTGEIGASLKNKLPKIIGYKDLRGDLHMHSNWSDGINTIEEIAEKAREMDLEYIAITDHIRAAFNHNVDEKELLKQGEEIDKLNTKYKILNTKFGILKGGEVDILNDGRLFMKDEILKKLDVVGVAIHSGFKMPKQKMTERIIRAMKNPYVDILFHPTGRLINERPPYEVDIEKVIRAARDTKTILEISAFPNRLDLKDDYIRMAIKEGVKLIIDSDAHSIFHLQFLEFGIAQARRGWATKKDVINTQSVEQFLKSLKPRTRTSSVRGKK